MPELIWNPKWQLSPPEKIECNEDGSIPFKGPIGNVFLPDDYLSFMLKTNGAALRDQGSFFIAEFQDATTVFQIEWLGKLNTVMFETWDFYEQPEPETHKLPKYFVSVGYAEPGMSRVVLCADRKSNDYGKVSIWVLAKDSWMTGDNIRGLGFVAKSFNEFMNNLQTAESMNHSSQ